METVVQKWGNSLGIRIPSPYVKELDLKSGSNVKITTEDGKIVITPKKLNLDDLLAQITEDNLHDTLETGDSVGKEEW